MARCRNAGNIPQHALVMLVTWQAFFKAYNQICFLMHSTKGMHGKTYFYLNVTQAQGVNRFIYAFKLFSNVGFTTM